MVKADGRNGGVEKQSKKGVTIKNEREVSKLQALLFYFNYL